MNSTKILPPHIPYTLPCSFGAIDHGKIFIGQYGTDPTVVANRIPIYIMDINGKMTRVEQPIITNSAGQSMYNDVPTNFYCFDRYSIMVQNAYGDKLFFEMIPGGEFGIPARFDFRTGGTVTTHDTVVFHPAAPGTNHYYFWEGALPKTVPANSAPTPLGPGFWVDVALRLTQDGYDDDYDDVLRFELGANSGATLVGTSTGENVEERITNLTPEDIGAQPVDATLTAMAGVPTAADKMIYFTGVDVAASTTLTPFARTLIDDANAAAARTTIGAQPLDATLTAMAGVPTAADKIIYFDGVDTAKSTTLTGFGRSLIDDANATAARTTLGAQAADATLTAMAGVVTAADKIIYFDGVDTAKPTTLTGFGRSLIDDASASEARTTLGAAATVHTHPISDVINLQATLDGKLALIGGTMTGDLTAPNVIVTTAPSADNHATTKSYVDTSITTAIDSVPLDDYLPISGGAIHGNLTISPPEGGNGLVLLGQPTNLPYVLGTSSGVTGGDWYLGQFGESTDVFLSNFDLTNYIALKSGYAESGLDLRLAGTQGTEPNSLTRRDFVESAVSNKVDKAGDVMTGGLQALNFQARDIEQGMQGIRIGGGADYSEVIPVDSEGSVLWTESLRYLPDTGKWTAQTQGTEPNSLARRDFVESAVSNKVDKAGDEMTGGLRALNFQARDIEQGFQGIRISGDANYSEVIPVDSGGSVLWTESLRYLPDTGKWTAQVQGTEPTSLTTKQYVDDAIAAGGGGGMTFTELGDAVDLNTITTPGYYMQSSDAQATSGSNYPEDAPGILIVYPLPSNVDSNPDAPILCMQFYYTELFSHHYTRYLQIDGNWRQWYQIYNTGNSPSASQVGVTPFGLATESLTPYVTDCNTTSTYGEYGGWYKISSTTTNTPYTTGDPKTNNAIMHTLSAVDKNKTQVFYAAGPDPETWIRNVYDVGGVKTWGTWQKVFPAEGGGSTTLGGLTDVADTVASATEGQVLTYNATSLEWEAKTLAAGGSGDYLPLTGGTLAGDLIVNGTSSNPLILDNPSGTNTSMMYKVGGVNRLSIDCTSATQAVFTYYGDGGNSNYFVMNPDFVSFSKEVRCSASASGNSNAFYTRAQGDARWLLKSGSAMTGLLTISSNGTLLKLNSTSSTSAYIEGVFAGAENWKIGSDVNSFTIAYTAPAIDTLLTLDDDFISANKDLHMTAVQGTDVSSLTRRDFVEGLVASARTDFIGHLADANDMIAELRSENTSLRDRVDALEQLVNQILGVG